MRNMKNHYERIFGNLERLYYPKLNFKCYQGAVKISDNELKYRNHTYADDFRIDRCGEGAGSSRNLMRTKIKNERKEKKQYFFAAT